MATPPIPTAPSTPPAEAAAPQALTPQVILATMLRAGSHVSDLIFSPGRFPQVEQSGQLVPVRIQGMQPLRPDDTANFAAHLIGNNKLAMEKLRTEGSCDISYSLPRQARFRVNIFTQRGTCAIVMRVIPNVIPDFETLNLPPQLVEIVGLKNGIVLVTGPTGSGKSSTLAALIDKINEETGLPHPHHRRSPSSSFIRTRTRTIHQRELHSDTPAFALALRAALRQAPKVILVGEMRDRETIEIAMEAAETGHLVMSTLHTIDASKTVERICGVFPLA